MVYNKIHIRFSKRSKTSLTAPFVHLLRRNAKNSFSRVKNKVKRVLLKSLEECTVSISIKAGSSSDEKSEYVRL